MKKLVSLLLWLSLGFFTMARAANPAHLHTAAAKNAHGNPMPQRADAENSVNYAGKTPAEEDTDENGISDDEGEGISDDDNGDVGDEDTSQDDEGDDDSDNSGGDEGD
jgi:hypothetical protein